MRILVMILAVMVNGEGMQDEKVVPWLPKGDRGNVGLSADGTLEISGKQGASRTTLLEIEKPKVTTPLYRLRGRVRHEDVEGTAFVEMLSVFATRGTFFSRTLAQVGPMMSITGTSDWREIEIPFMSEPDLLPEKISAAFVMPGQGKVWFTPMSISVSNSSSMPSSATESNRRREWLIAGGVAVLLGVTGAMGMVRGGVRRVARGMAVALMFVGMVLFVLGTFCWCLGFHPREGGAMLLAGGTVAFCSWIMSRTFRAWIQVEESQRMKACDLVLN
ncbi:MAG: hypothetical protein U1D30_19795 [Planctomycetota bacterium]